MKCCANCGEVRRRGKNTYKYFCATGDVVKRDCVCDGWKPNLGITANEFFRRVDRAMERMNEPDWEISKPRLMKNYRSAEDDK